MLAKYLKDFSAPDPLAAVEVDLVSSLSGAAFAELDFDAELPPEIDLEAERREARDEGYCAAAEELGMRHAADLEMLNQAHAEEMQALARQHEDETVATIHARFQDMTQTIVQTLAEQTLQLVLPILEEDVAKRSIEALSAQIRDLLANENATIAIIRGPMPLYTALKPLLDGDGIATRHIETAGIDIAVEINETVLVTRLAEWSSSLAEALA